MEQWRIWEGASRAAARTMRLRGKDLRRPRVVQARNEGTEEGEANEAGGADGEALADGGGRVARGVEGVRLLAD